MGLKRMLRVAGTAAVASLALAAVAAGTGVNPALAGSGATVLRGHFSSNELFLVDGIPALFTFSCDEQRIQLPDGSARDIAHCVLDAGQTAPPSAALAASAGYLSDFFIAGTPGFTGATIATDWHGVVTPSGQVTMVAEFPAP